MKLNSNDIREVYINLAVVRGSKNKYIDGIELYTVLLLLMQTGIQKKEIGTLLFSDLVYKTNRITGINLKNNGTHLAFIEFSTYLSMEMRRYISHKFSNIKTSQLYNIPLFPTYYDSKGVRQILRNLEKYDYQVGSFLHSWEIGYLQDVGIKEYYYQLKRNNIDEKACIQQIASQYRLTYATVKKKLDGDEKDKKQSTLEKFMEHQDQGAIKVFNTQTEIDVFIQNGINLIKKIKIPKTEKNKIEADFLENAKKISIKAKKTSPVKSDKKDLVKTIKETSVKNKNKKTSSQTINEMKALLGTLGPEEEIDTILKKIFNK